MNLLFNTIHIRCMSALNDIGFNKQQQEKELVKEANKAATKITKEYIQFFDEDPLKRAKENKKLIKTIKYLFFWFVVLLVLWLAFSYGFIPLWNWIRSLLR